MTKRQTKSRAERIYLSAIRNKAWAKCLIKDAHSGSLRAQHNLGACYATGDFPTDQDLRKAVFWYRKAASAGDAESQYDLGFMILMGEGLRKDIRLALRWLEKSAGQGCEQAQTLLIDLYKNGHYSVRKNPTKVAKWRKLQTVGSGDASKQGEEMT